MFKPMASAWQTKIFLIAALVSLGLFLSLGLHSLISLRQARQTVTSALLSQLVNQQTAKLKEFVSSKLNSLSLVITQPGVTAVSLSEQRSLLQRLLKQELAWQGSAFINPVGQETAHLVEGGLSVPLVSHQDQPAFKAALAGQQYIGPVEFEGQEAYLAIAVPVINRAGAVIAVWWGRLNLGSLRQEFNKIRLGTSGYLYVLTSDQQILAESNAFPFDRAAFKPHALVQTLLQDSTYNILGPEQNYDDVNGRQVLIAGQRVPVVNWTVVAAWPEDEIISSSRELIQALAVLILVVWLLTLAVIYLAVVFLIKPQSLSASPPVAGSQG
jgi:hypothetical protein